MNKTEEVQDKLSKGGVVCKNVGELKSLLEHVPDDLPCRMDDGPVQVVWYNQGRNQTGMREHLSFREPFE